MRKPTKQDYLSYAGYPRSLKVEVCACEYDSQGNILDFATETWAGRDLRSVPTDTPLQLNILDSDGEKVEDLGITINGKTGEISPL